MLRAAKIVWRDKFEDARPFQREFEGVQKFERISKEHPGQLALFHIGRNEAEGYFYYVMELADGVGVQNPKSKVQDSSSVSDCASSSLEDYSPRTLRTDLAEGRLPAERVLEIGLALTEALSHLHRNRLVHRDVKPSNVIFVKGRPKLADIGLVTDASDRLSIAGTEGYLPPQGPGTPQADIYALGKTLYEAATGMDRREFPKLPEDLRQWPDAAQVFELNEIMLSACASDTRDGYITAEAMLTDLQRLQQGKSVKRSRAVEEWKTIGKRFATALAGLTIMAALIAVATRGIRPADPFPDGPESTDKFANAYCEKAMSVIRNDTYQEFGEAYTNFHLAIELDPRFARPYVGLLEFRLREPAPFLTNAESLPELAKKLKTLAPDLGATATAQAIVSYYDWDFEAAQRYARRAVKANPRYELSHTWYGFMLAHWDRPGEARAELEASTRLQPSKAIILRCIGHAYYVERNFFEATNYYQQAIHLDGHHAQDFWCKARAQRALGDYRGSMATDAEGDGVSKRNASGTSNRLALLRQAFDAGGARGYWEQAGRSAESNSISRYDKAAIRIHLGDTNGALALLHESFTRNENRGREGGLPYLLFDETWDAVRGDPRFKDLLDKIGFTKVMPPPKK
jgi:serine/threonine protein kinase